jgi:hypothetical protein
MKCHCDGAQCTTRSVVAAFAAVAATAKAASTATPDLMAGRREMRTSRAVLPSLCSMVDLLPRAMTARCLTPTTLFRGSRYRRSVIDSIVAAK